MKILLDVPYVSQEARDAQKYGNDCGIACVKMVHDYLYPDRLTKTVDQLATMWPPNPFSTTADLVELGRLVNLQLISTDRSLGRVLDLVTIRSQIDAGLPIIVLVCYGRIGQRMNQKYAGGHYLVVTGYDTDNDLFFVNDPDWWGSRHWGGHGLQLGSATLINAMWSCPGYFSVSEQGLMVVES